MERDEIFGEPTSKMKNNGGNSLYLKSCNCLQELHQRHTMCTGEPRSRQHNLQKGDSEARHSDTSTADRISWRTNSSGFCTITYWRRSLLFAQIWYLMMCYLLTELRCMLQFNVYTWALLFEFLCCKNIQK